MATSSRRRIVRAKRKIQEARIPYEIPGPGQLAERLSGVQAVLYLVFNEGYLAAVGDDLLRASLCDEAISPGPDAVRSPATGCGNARTARPNASSRLTAGSEDSQW